MRAIVVVALLQLCTPTFAASPTNCVGESCVSEDANALLQTHVRSTIETHASDNNIKAQDLLQDVLSMMEGTSRGSGDPPKRDLSKLHLVRKIVNDTLMPGILDAHKFAQASLTSFGNQFDACVSDADAGIKEIASMLDGATTVETSHKTCRGDEGVLKGTMDAECSKLQQFLDAYDPSGTPEAPTNLQTCNAPTDLKCKLPSKDLADVGAFLAAQNAFYLDFHAKNESCNTSSGEHSAKAKDCDKEQTTFESDFCQYRTKLIDTNLSAAACYDGVKAEYDVMKTKTEVDVEKWKAEYNATQMILCYLDTWLHDNNTKTVNASFSSLCRSKTFDATKMDVNYPTVPPRPDVSMVPVLVYPGHEDFVGARYGSLHSYNPDVTACLTHTVAPTTTTTTVLIAEVKRIGNDNQANCNNGICKNTLDYSSYAYPTSGCASPHPLIDGDTAAQACCGQGTRGASSCFDSGFAVKLSTPTSGGVFKINGPLAVYQGKYNMYWRFSKDGKSWTTPVCSAKTSWGECFVSDKDPIIPAPTSEFQYFLFASGHGASKFAEVEYIDEAFSWTAMSMGRGCSSPETSGSIKWVYYGKSLDECKQVCVDDVNCAAVDYRQRDGACGTFTNSATVIANPTNVHVESSWQCHVKNFGRASWKAMALGRGCSSPETKGAIHWVYYGKTLSDCQKVCADDPLCKAIDWRHTDKACGTFNSEATVLTNPNNVHIERYWGCYLKEE